MHCICVLLHLTELQCILLNYAAPCWAVLHTAELRCTLQGCSAPCWVTLRPTELPYSVPVLYFISYQLVSVLCVCIVYWKESRSQSGIIIVGCRHKSVLRIRIHWNRTLSSSVADPDSLNPDPDQAFEVKPDTNPDPRFWWQKIGKQYSWENIFSWLKIEIYRYLSLGLLKGRPSYRRSLLPLKENTQHFKKWNLLTFLFCGHVCPPGSGSRDPIESGSKPDLDPQHCYPGFLMILYPHQDPEPVFLMTRN